MQADATQRRAARQAARPARAAVVLASTGHQAIDHRLFDKEARTLAAAGFDVCVLALHARAESRDGVEIAPLRARPGRIDRFVIRPWRALREIRRRRPDVVHLHDAELLVICPALRLLGHPVVVYDVHEDFGNLMLRRDWIPRVLRRLVRGVLRLAERLLARSVDAVVSVTPPLADEFPTRRPTVALYNLPTPAFVERAGQDAEPPSRRPVDLIHLGVLSGERLEFLLAVLTELVARRPAVRVRIVGVPPAQERRLAEAFAPSVLEVHGKVPYDDVARMTREAKLGLNVHPVLHPHLRVAVPVKVFDYMAAGCGVVTSWLPELASLLDGVGADNLTVLRDVGPEAYADAVDGWLSDPDRLDAAGAGLHELVTTTHSWDTQGRKLVSLYERLL